MANANISAIQLTNTFDEWRVSTNDLIVDRNTLRNAVYVKDESDFEIANGAMVISRSTGGTVLTLTGQGSALVGGTTTTSDLIVQDDAAVANQLIVTGNTIITGTLNVNNKLFSHNANGDFVVTTGNLYIGANSTLNSNLSVSKNAVVTQNLSVEGTSNVTGNFRVNTNQFRVVAATGDTIVNGDLTVSGGDIEANTITLNLVNNVVETLNFAQVANALSIGNTTSTTTINGDLVVSGGDITSTATANLLNAVTTTLNLGGGATAINMGDAAGTVTVAGDLVVSGGDITSTPIANIANTSATEINFGGATALVRIGSTSSTVNVRNNLTVTNDLSVLGGDITSTATANLLNSGTTTLNLGGAATTVEIGAATGTTNINNNLDVDGDVNIDGGNLTVSTSSFNLADTTATTVNLARAATLLTMGSLSGTTNVRNNLNVTGDLDVDGGDITSTATANLLNSGTTTINFGGAAISLNMGAGAGLVAVAGDLQVNGNDIRSSSGANALTLSGSDVNVVGDLQVSGNDIKSSTGANALTLSGSDVTVGGDLQVNGNDIKSSSGSNALSLSGSDVTVVGDLQVSGNDIKSSSGANALTLSGSDATVVGDLTVSGGDIISTATVNLLNTSTTLISLGGAAANVNLGSPTGTVNVRNRLYATDNVYLPQGKNLFAYFIHTSASENDLFIERGNGVFRNVDVRGTFTLSSPATSTANSFIINEVPSVARNATFTVRRGSPSSNAFLQWNESAGLWRAASSDASISTILTVSNVVNSLTSTSVIDAAAPNSVKLSYDAAVAAYGQANAARNQANTAYDAANTKLAIAGGTITGSLVISGNLFVEGTSTTLNVSNLQIEDNEIVLNSNTVGSPVLNATLLVNRGSSTNTFIRWDENVDRWGWSDNGTTFYTFETAINAYQQANNAYNAANNVALGTAGPAYTQANNAYNQANNAYNQANAAYGQANSAFSAANNRVSSVSGTSGRITSSGGLTPSIDLATAGAGAATYSSGISALSVDAYGRVTSVTGSANYTPTNGSGASGTWSISITGNAGTVTGGVYTSGDQTIGGTKTFTSTITGSITGNAGTVGGLSVHAGTNNEPNKVVRTDASGYLQVGYIHSSTGNEGNNSNPARVWGTNGSDSYLRTYLTSALSVGYAASAGAVAWTNVSGRPTALSAFTNDVGYVTSAGVGVTSITAAGGLSGGTITSTGTISLHSSSTSGGSTSLASGAVYVVTSDNQTITLPGSPSAGQFVKISVGNFINTTIDRNGQNIMGLAENMTVDVAYIGISLIYVDATYGWRLF